MKQASCEPICSKAIDWSGGAPPPVGTRNPLVLGSSGPTPVEPLRRRGAQGGSGSSLLNWIPNRGVQGRLGGPIGYGRRPPSEPVQMILRSTYLLAGRLAACRARCDREQREGVGPGWLLVPPRDVQGS